MFWRPLFTESNLPNVLDDEFQNVVNDLGDKRGYFLHYYVHISLVKRSLCNSLNLYIYSLMLSREE